jgi:myo-inositol-1(or 4)-monophosphatase
MLARAGTIRLAAGFQSMAENLTQQDSAIAGHLPDIEQLAVELARLAGAEIVNALGSLLAIRYKTAATADDELWRDPVSEVDNKVEKLIRARLAEEFPDHDVIGEEMTDRPGRDHEIVWAVDPIDGTANFINGFPMFAASIGVLDRGVPVAGALWCSASHALRSGVYHARRGGRLRFEGEDVTPRTNPAVRTGLAGLPEVQPADGHWDSRKTGSAAIECALTAAGILRVARFDAPNIWDVAGGLALVQAAGGAVRQHGEDGWRPFERFVPEPTAAGTADLRFWRHPLVIGRPEAVARMCGRLDEGAATSRETAAAPGR